MEISKGIAEMASEGGRIQIVASPYLSDEDIEAIKKGYDYRNNIIEKLYSHRLRNQPIITMERLNSAALIADGVMDIRSPIRRINGIGMYHEKMG